MDNKLLYIILIVLITIYFCAIICSVLKKRLSKIAFIIGFPIIIISNIILRNILSGTFFPITSIFLGIILYIADVFILNFKVPIEAVSVIFDVSLYKKKSLLWGSLLKCTYEELLWRQTLIVFGGAWFLTVPVALLFSLTHLCKQIKLREVICLFMFALFEYYILFKFGNIFNCIIIHIARNICAILLQTKLEGLEEK